MTERERLQGELHAVEERETELKAELSAVRQERTRLAQLLARLEPTPRQRAEASRVAGCTCSYHETCKGLTVCPKCLRCVRCADHAEGCPGCPASWGNAGENPERIGSVDAVPATPGGEPEVCPDAQLPDGPTCPRCGGPRAPSGVGGGSWVHFPRGGETL